MKDNILLLTQTNRAGIGVQFFKWIIANKYGKWPSLAPEKHNLQRDDQLHPVRSQLSILPQKVTVG